MAFISPNQPLILVVSLANGDGFAEGLVGVYGFARGKVLVVAWGAGALERKPKQRSMLEREPVR